MNLVYLVSDTLRWDYIGAYGNRWIETPNLDALAAESLRYTQAFAEGLPTVEARRVIMTGRPIFPFKYRPQLGDGVQMQGWHPLFDEDVTIAEHLQRQGFVTCMVTDVYHMMKPGKNFHRGFDTWHWIRGQEADTWELDDPSRVADIIGKLPPSADPKRVPWIVRYLNVRRQWKSDADTLVGQVMRTAADWVKGYSLDRPFFMYIDCFDPHEPWDPPVADGQRYKKDFNVLNGLLPAWETAKLDANEFGDAKAAYAGEVTLVDRWIGHFLKALKATGRDDDTLIVMTSDHGCMMGEHGELHKSETRLRNQVTQVPLLIRHPRRDRAGQTQTGYVQHFDITPTACDLLGIPKHERMTGVNVWPRDGKTIGRDPIVTAFGHFASVRTQQWNYITPWTQLPAGRTAREELYDLAADHEERTNVIAEHKDVAQQLRAVLVEHVKAMAPQTDGRFQQAAPGSGKLSFDCVQLSTDEQDSAKI